MKRSGYKLLRYPKDGQAQSSDRQLNINGWWTQTQVQRVTGMKPDRLKKLAADGVVTSVETTRSMVYRPADVVAAMENGGNDETD